MNLFSWPICLLSLIAHSIAAYALFFSMQYNWQTTCMVVELILISLMSYAKYKVFCHSSHPVIVQQLMD